MSKDDATWLVICYLAAGLIAMIIGYYAIDTLGVQTGWSERYDEWFPFARSIGSIAIGVIGVAILRTDRERHEYFLTSIGELRKVTWPTVDDTKKMTLVVVVVVAIFGVILAVFDLFWAWAFKLLVV